MEQHALLYLVFLFVAIATVIPETLGKGTGCEAEFKGRCRCKYLPSNQDSHGKRQLVTNCTNAGFDNTAMLHELPVNSAQLIFTGNRINKIRTHVFGTLNDYSELKLVDLSNNNIRRIDPYAFTRATQHVEELNLSGNMWELNDESNIFGDFPALRKLHLVGAFGLDQSSEHILQYLRQYFKDAQKQLARLEVLHLENNHFEHFDDDSFFCFLPKLRELYLSNNMISTFKLTSRCLAHLSNLEIIDLSRNRLQSLSNETMEALDSIGGYQPYSERQIDLNYNDFPCNCSLNDLLRWMDKTRVMIVDKTTYTCSVVNPSDGINTMQLDDLDGKLLPCLEVMESQASSDSPSPSHAGYIVLAVILVILIAISIGLAFINRAAVQQFLQHRASPLQHKFEYTTIGGRRDANEVDV